MQEIDIGMIRFRAFDLGGHTMARKVWDEYSQSADAVVFIIDACDRTRFQEAKVRSGHTTATHHSSFYCIHHSVIFTIPLCSSLRAIHHPYPN